MKKSISKASFEESLNLLDDGISGKFVQENYQDALKKRKIQSNLEVVCMVSDFDNLIYNRSQLVDCCFK